MLYAARTGVSGGAEMKKQITAAVLSVCVAAGACACAPAEEENVFTGEKVEQPEWQENLDAISPSVYASIDDLDLEPGTYISVIGKRNDGAYWEQVKAGVEQAADDINERLGYSGSDEIKVLFNAPSGSEDIDEQVNILDEEMARYPDVIAIASIDENASAVQFDLAISNGIPIVAFDSGNSYQGIQCICMTDNQTAAAEGAAKLCEAIGESGEVALLVQDSVSANAGERAQAFQQEIAENHPGVTVVETLYMDQLDSLKRQAAAEELGVTQEELETWTAAAAGEASAEGETQDSADASDSADAGAGAADTENSAGIDGEAADDGESMSETARAKLEDINTLAEEMSDEDVIAYYLQKHPELAGCFATNGDAVSLGANVLENMDKTEDIVLMGFDAGSDQVEDLENGSIDGLIVQNPFGMGYATVVAAARTVLEIGNEAAVNTGYIWADRDNLEDEAVQAMLYE